MKLIQAAVIYLFIGGVLCGAATHDKDDVPDEAKYILLFAWPAAYGLVVGDWLEGL